MILGGGRRCDLVDLLPAAAARALLRTECVSQWVNVWAFAQ